MNTDNKMDEKKITTEEQNTSHNAGVDLNLTSDDKTTKEPEDDFIDIDKAPVAKDDADLKNIGINFVDKSDLNILKEEMDKKAEAEKKAQELKEKSGEKIEQVKPETPTQKIPEAVKEVQKESSSVIQEQKIPEVKIEKTPEPVSPKQVKEEVLDQDSEIFDLEREFNQTVGSVGAVSKASSLNDDIFSLKLMLNKIKNKLGIKKTEVKEELGNLKKVKDDIAKDIENIKELEESEDKIEGQIKKIESIKGDITNIEKEVEQELNS